MKRHILTAILAMAGAGLLFGESGRGDRLSFGFGLNDSQNNFGLQGEITSPRFLGDIVALRVGGGVEFASADLFAGSGDYWEKYASLRAGIVAGSDPVAGAVRPYGGFGALFLFAENIAGVPLVPGIYGLFGVEFYTDEMLENSPVAYYFELGSSGIPAKAADVASEPAFYNGFKASAGVRFYF